MQMDGWLTDNTVPACVAGVGTYGGQYRQKPSSLSRLLWHARPSGQVPVILETSYQRCNLR